MAGGGCEILSREFPRLIQWGCALTALLVLLLSAWVVLKRGVKRGVWIAAGCYLFVVGLIWLSLREEGGVRGGDARLRVFVLADCSDSVDPGSRRRAFRLLEHVIGRIPPPHGVEVRFVPFAGGHVICDADRFFEVIGSGDGCGGLVHDRGRTRIAGALESIAEGSGADAKARTVLLVLCDGRLEDLDEAVEVLAGWNGRRPLLLPFLLDCRRGDGLAVLGVSGPEVVSVDSGEVTWFADVASESGVPCTLTVEDGGKVILRRKVSPPRGRSRVPVKLTLDTPGFHPLTFRLTPLSPVPDSITRNDVARFVVKVVGRSSILYLHSSESESAAVLEKAAARAGCSMLRLPIHRMPTDYISLSRHPIVVLDDVPPERLPLDKRKALSAYVEEEGGALLLVGGGNSLGSGGYGRGRFMDVLPVRVAGTRVVGDLGLILLVDSSGSMTGEGIFWAKESARKILSMMRGRFVGVYAFSSVCTEVVPLAFLDEGDVDAACEKVDNLVPGGGTMFSVALSTAMRELNSYALKHKYVIMLSDGRTSVDAPLILGTILPRMRRSGIKVSTVAVGDSVDEQMLQIIAKRTGGRFYRTRELSSLPRMLYEEVKRIAALPILEGRIRPWPVVKSWFEGLGTDRLPLLYGISLTRPRRGAELVMKTRLSHPVLAVWRKGKGKCAVFTSTLGPGWGRDWLKWKCSEKVFARLFRFLYGRKLERASLECGADGVLELYLLDEEGRPMDGTVPVLELRKLEAGGNTGRKVAMASAGGGRYHVFMADLPEGFYEVVACSPIRRRWIVAKGPGREYFLDGGADESALKTLARAAGSPERVYSPEDLSRLFELVHSSSAAAGVRGGGAADGGAECGRWSCSPWLLICAVLLYFGFLFLRWRGGVSWSDDDGTGAEGAGSAAAVAAYFREKAARARREGREEEARRYELNAERFEKRSRRG